MKQQQQNLIQESIKTWLLICISNQMAVCFSLCVWIPMIVNKIFFFNKNTSKEKFSDRGEQKHIITFKVDLKINFVELVLFLCLLLSASENMHWSFLSVEQFFSTYSMSLSGKEDLNLQNFSWHSIAVIRRQRVVFGN